jgi:hypothetical protein
MTAPTPIMIPNMVKAERILFTTSALRAIRRLARSLVIIMEIEVEVKVEVKNS